MMRKISEGFAIIEMYTTSHRGAVLINGENYWPVNLKHRSRSTDESTQ